MTNKTPGSDAERALFEVVWRETLSITIDVSAKHIAFQGFQAARSLPVQGVDAERRYQWLRDQVIFETVGDACTMKLSVSLPAPDHDCHKDWMSPRFEASADKTIDAAILENKGADHSIAPPPDAGWLPIETVPKDGTEIILLKGLRVGAAQWCRWPASEHEDAGESWSISGDGDDWNDEKAPTHWQPLPPPPIHQQAKEGL